MILNIRYVNTVNTTYCVLTEATYTPHQVQKTIKAKLCFAAWLLYFIYSPNGQSIFFTAGRHPAL